MDSHFYIAYTTALAQYQKIVSCEASILLTGIYLAQQKELPRRTRPDHQVTIFDHVVICWCM